jgi:putative lipase involved disintegration of autophagic bodies
MAQATVIAHCDRLGYLRCVECHEARECVSDQPVFSDDGWTDACDCCGKPIDAQRKP